MSDEPLKPLEVAPNQSIPTGKRSSNRDSIVAIVLVCLLVGAVAIGVSRLRAPQLPEGRPIGAAGKVEAFALPTTPSGEGFTIWRGNRQIQELTINKKAGYERVELSSNDIDIAGNAHPDLVLYTWTGGAHCCFTQILIDGSSGKLLGTLELGNSDPTPFLAAPKKGFARAVALGVDDVSAYKFGSYADSPMARILVVWDGHKFALDTKRMKAALPDSPPAFFINEPELGEAASIGVQDFGQSEDDPGASTSSKNARGDRAKTYTSWMEGEEARMRDTALEAEDTTGFGAIAAFLNEQIYKGQGAVGVQTVLEAHKDAPDAAAAALSYYFSVLKQSRWLGDLNKLNDGGLTTLIETYSNRPQNGPTAVAISKR